MKNEDFFKAYPTEQEMLNQISRLEESVKGHEEAAECRMLNYYINCIDDYSFGGLCDQATSKIINDNRELRQRLNEQLNQIRTVVSEEVIDVLTDLATGEIVSDRLVNGKFGMCWIVGSGDDVKFVGLAKKAKTYESKGYAVVRMTYTVESYINAYASIVARVTNKTSEPFDFSDSLFTYKSPLLRAALRN